MTPSTEIVPDVSPSAAPAPAYTSQRWWLLALLISGMMLCFAQRAALNIAAPMMIKDMGFSPAIMGVLLSAFGWTYALGQAPSGWLADRYGFRRVYAAGFVLWSVATAALGMVSHTVALVLLRMGVGVGQATIFPASSRRRCHVLSRPGARLSHQRVYLRQSVGRRADQWPRHDPACGNWMEIFLSAHGLDAAAVALAVVTAGRRPRYTERGASAAATLLSDESASLASSQHARHRVGLFCV